MMPYNEVKNERLITLHRLYTTFYGIITLHRLYTTLYGIITFHRLYTTLYGIITLHRLYTTLYGIITLHRLYTTLYGIIAGSLSADSTTISYTKVRKLVYKRIPSLGIMIGVKASVHTVEGPENR